MPDMIPMTQNGYHKLQQEVRELESRRPDIKASIEQARARGDLSENADYHAAREELAMLNARLAELHGKLARSHVVKPEDAPEGKAALGSTVRLRRKRDGREFTRTLVGAGEGDVASGKILTTSPMGAAMIGHEAGDTVTVSLPSGEQEFEILSIS